MTWLDSFIKGLSAIADILIPVTAFEPEYGTMETQNTEPQTKQHFTRDDAQ